MNWSNVGKKLAQVFTTAAQDLNPVLVVEGPKRYAYATCSTWHSCIYTRSLIIQPSDHIYNKTTAST